MSEPLLPAVPDMERYRRLHGDPAPWLPAIRAICQRHGLGADGAYCEPTGTNVVFRVAGGPWIKLFPPLWQEDYVRERVGLSASQGVPGLAVPELLHAGEIEGWPYLILGHLAGKGIGQVWSDMPREAQCDVARQLGELLARLRRVDTDGCTALREDDWTSYAHGLWADAVDRQRRAGLAPAWAKELGELLEAWGPPAAPNQEVLLHADVTDEHVILREEGERWRVTGLLDFGDAMLGDPDYELAAPLVFLLQRRPAAQRALLEGYGLARADLTPELGRRLVRWCLIHRFGQIAHYPRFTPEPRPNTLHDLVLGLWCP